MEKQRWMTPITWSHRFRKSIAVGKSLLRAGFLSLDNPTPYSDRELIKVDDWEIYSDKDLILAVYTDKFGSQHFYQKEDSVPVQDVQTLITQSITEYEESKIHATC